MKIFLFLITFSITVINSIAQKKAIDTSDFSRWQQLSPPLLSNDGNYLAYTIFNYPIGSNTLVIISTQNTWNVQITDALSYNGSFFSKDNKCFVFKKVNTDSLGIIKLGTSDIDYVPMVKSFKVMENSMGEWLAYQLSNLSRDLVLNNLTTGAKLRFTSVNDFSFFNAHDGLLVSRVLKDTQSLIVFRLENLDSTKIWEGVKIRNLIFDTYSSQLAFLVEKKNNGLINNSLWYYKIGKMKAECLGDDRSLCSNPNLSLNKIERFSKNGNRIIYVMKEIGTQAPGQDAISVDIYSYLDPKLQSRQLKEAMPAFVHVINIQNKNIIRLEQENERIVASNKFNDDYVIVLKREGEPYEWNWNRLSKSAAYLMSVDDGKRIALNNKKLMGNIQNFWITPSGKYVLFYSPDSLNYFSYEISTGVYRNLTKGIKAYWWSPNDEPMSFTNSLGIAGFLEDSSKAIIYEQNDIYLIDFTGQNKPLNITNGYGKEKNIVFRLIKNYEHDKNLISINDNLIVSAFNLTNKNDGFYRVSLNSRVDPELLLMDAHMYTGITIDCDCNVELPVKAKNAEAYVVRRMRSNEAPNYFFTTDFKSFIQLSNIQPQLAFNWLKTELISWKSIDGTAFQGLLYKPEDFTPNKKYPLIFYYYERYSNGLHSFLQPRYCEDNLNIPYFVSNGYLVFIPDIHYTIGYPGKSAYKSIVSAAKHLSRFSWVDAKKLGLQGHSFGGFETNYVISLTNIFSAACSFAGMSNFTSIYGSIIGMGTSRQMQYEMYRDRIGKNLWDGQELYIENSPVLRANKIQTPLLMMANKADGDVPYAQGVELFTALRRLGKKVWMLQYDEGYHSVFGKEAIDLTIRMKQYFDHYLKGQPAPIWMTRGIPAKMKGIDLGYELDKEIKSPRAGLLITEKE